MPWCGTLFQLNPYALLVVFASKAVAAAACHAGVSASCVKRPLTVVEVGAVVLNLGLVHDGGGLVHRLVDGFVVDRCVVVGVVVLIVVMVVVVTMTALCRVACTAQYVRVMQGTQQCTSTHTRR